jgi:uncharacterized iron-regulated membrane protein
MTTTPTRAAPSSALYRAVWRWHFIAGLIVLPFMILLAVTGGIYLYKDEVNAVFQPELRIVTPQDGGTQAPSTLTAAALAAHEGRLHSYFPPAAPDASAQVKIVNSDGGKDIVYVNPYTAEVLGTLWDAGPSGSKFMYIVRKLHSLEYIGWFGNRLIEAAAGWMILLVASGVYLWWPRGRNVGTTTIKRKTGRGFWRDLHAVTGIYTAGFIVFLALTGLPWSSVWGGKFYDITYAMGMGMPDGYWGKYPSSTVPMGEALDKTAWIMEKQPMLNSTTSEGVPAGLDQVVRIVEDAGIHPGYALNVPSSPEGVFTASVYPDDISFERVIHIDQYSGEILFDVGLDGLGTFGKAAEWGISLHMGQAFGLANQIILTLACIAMVAMSVAGGLMWWKRRPTGALGTPTMPSDWRIPRTLLVMSVVAGVFFPLVGLSMILLALVELVIALRNRRQNMHPAQ